MVVVIIDLDALVAIAVHSFGNVTREVVGVVFFCPVSFADFGDAAPVVQYITGFVAVTYPVTPNRGKEFARHAEFTENLGGLPFYFPQPHHPLAEMNEREHPWLAKRVPAQRWRCNRLDNPSLSIIIKSHRLCYFI